MKKAIPTPSKQGEKQEPEKNTTPPPSKHSDSLRRHAVQLQYTPGSTFEESFSFISINKTPTLDKPSSTITDPRSPNTIGSNKSKYNMHNATNNLNTNAKQTSMLTPVINPHPAKHEELDTKNNISSMATSKLHENLNTLLSVKQNQHATTTPLRSNSLTNIVKTNLKKITSISADNNNTKPNSSFINSTTIEIQQSNTTSATFVTATLKEEFKRPKASTFSAPSKTYNNHTISSHKIKLEPDLEKIDYKKKTLERREEELARKEEELKHQKQQFEEEKQVFLREKSKLKLEKISIEEQLSEAKKLFDTAQIKGAAHKKTAEDMQIKCTELLVLLESNLAKERAVKLEQAKVLFTKIYSGDLNAVQHLINIVGLNPNTPGEDGKNALHHAVIANKTNIVEFLLKRAFKKANPNAHDKRKRLPLHDATDNSIPIEKFNLDILKLLLWNDAETLLCNPETLDKDNHTALRFLDKDDEEASLNPDYYQLQLKAKTSLDNHKKAIADSIPNEINKWKATIERMQKELSLKDQANKFQLNSYNSGQQKALHETVDKSLLPLDEKEKYKKLITNAFEENEELIEKTADQNNQADLANPKSSSRSLFTLRK